MLSNCRWSFRSAIKDHYVTCATYNDTFRTHKSGPKCVDGFSRGFPSAGFTSYKTSELSSQIAVRAIVLQILHAESPSNLR